VLGDLERQRKVEPSIEHDRLVQVGRRERAGRDLELRCVDVVPVEPEDVFDALVAKDCEPRSDAAAEIDHGRRMQRVEEHRHDGLG